MAGKQRPAKPLGLIKVADEGEEGEQQAPDHSLASHVEKAMQKSASGKQHGGVQEEDMLQQQQPLKAAAGGKPGAGVVSRLERLDALQQEQDVGTDDEDDRYEVMSRSTLKARSLALNEVMRGSGQPAGTSKR